MSRCCFVLLNTGRVTMLFCPLKYWPCHDVVLSCQILAVSRCCLSCQILAVSRCCFVLSNTGRVTMLFCPAKYWPCHDVAVSCQILALPGCCCVRMLTLSVDPAKYSQHVRWFGVVFFKDTHGSFLYSFVRALTA